VAGPPPPPPPPTTATVTVASPSGTLVPAVTVQLVATAKAASGEQLQRSFSWSSSDLAKATVSTAGVLTAVAPGQTTITATVDGKSGSLVVTVLDGGVVSSAGSTLNLESGVVQIVVPADAVTSATPLSVAPSTAYGADARVVKGTPFDFGPSGAAFAKPVDLKIKYDPANLPAGTEESALELYLSTSTGWQVVAGSVADTAANVVSAPVSHFSTYAILTPEVVAAISIAGTPVPIIGNAASLVAGASNQLTATLTASDGRVLTNRAITWTTSDQVVASIGSNGVVTAVGPGVATVSASASGKTASVTITVTPVPVALVSVSLAAATIEVGQVTQATAATFDAKGNPLMGRVVTWSSSDNSVATVSTSGAVTAVGVGTAAITAASEGKSGSAAISVTAIPVATVTLTPEAASLVPGGTQQLTATARDISGNTLSDRAVSWSSDNSAVATVSNSGLVTAVGTGTATISAASEGKIGTASITVTPVPVASVTVSPATTSMVAGSTQQLSAETKDAANNVITGRVVSWSSSDPAVATVSTTGLVAAVTPGTATITATSEGQSGTSSITVTAVPVASVGVTLAVSSINAVETTQATATTLDGSGGVLTGRSVTWNSANPAIATVSNTGFVTAISAGTANIIATSEGKSGSALLTVSPAPVASVTVTLVASSITAAQTTPAMALLKDAQDRTLTGRSIAWSSANPSVATVSPAGVVTGVAPGTTTIVATSEGQNGSATITVTSVPVATVTVTLLPNLITAVETSQATAVTLAAGGETLSGREITWISENTGIATVSSTGVVTAVSVGTTSIVATSEGRSGGAILTVTPAPVASVSVTLANASISAVETTQASSTLRDANGGVLTGRAVAWSSDNPGVATVSPSGAVTAVSAGTANIIASSEGKSAGALLTVTPAPVASVTVTLAATSINSVEATQATAILKDLQDRVLTGRPIAWSSDNTAIATVSSSGLVTAVSVGTVNIVATSEGQSGSASLTVTPAPVASVVVDPVSATVTVGSTEELSVTLRDAHNNLLTGRVVAWTSSVPSVATVSSTGVVTAVAAGSATITATSEGQSASSTITVTPVPVATVSVSLALASINAGQTTQATATVLDAEGGVLTGRTVAWSSTSTSVATISSAGVVTAVAPGTATITATSDGKSGSATLTVTPVPVASVTVNPATASVVAGATRQLTAETRDASGNILAGRAVVWSSSQPAVATVSITGLVTAVASGTTTITATSEGKAGTSAITVTPVPVASVTVSLAATSINAVETTQATATTLDGSGGVLTGRAVTWTSSNTAVATVSGSGLVTAVSAGTANITATSEGKSGSATLTVTPAPVASVSVTLAASNITAIQTTQATSTLRDVNGVLLTGRAVAWTSDNTAVATVSSSGLVTAVSAGTANITATSEGQSGSAPLTVTPAPVASVNVSPVAATVVAGSTRQLSAETRDGANNVVTGRVVTWSSSDAAVATVSTTGLVTAVAPGAATITATSEGQSGTSSITVTPVPVASVTVALAASSINAIETTQATATTHDASGNVLTGRTLIWSSDNTAVATVSSTGLVTAVGVGTVNIVAASEGISGSVTLTVSPAPVASVSVSIGLATFQANQSTQAIATTRDANNNVLSGRLVAWSSDNVVVATVSSSGLVSGVSPGTATITATSEGKTGTVTITITAVPVASVTVGLVPSTITAVETSQATATTRDAAGVELTGRAITWSSDNTSVATVSSAGVVTAVSAGTANIAATSEGETGSASLTVTPAPVATVTVTPTTVSVVRGSTQQLAAETRDAHNTVLTGRAVSWSSSNESVATVAAGGLVTGVASGSATITATSEGQSGSSSITVTPAPVASVSVALAPSTITAVGTAQATATTLDGGGGVLTGRTVTWSSDNQAVATVSSAGLVTAVAAGSVNIVATSEGRTGSAALTVTPAPVATVTVSPAAPSIVAGNTEQLTATLKDSQDRVLTGRTVTWQSDNETVASVSPSGVVTGVAPGTATITASSEGQSGTSSITVTPAPVASVTVTLAAGSINAVETTQASAVTRAVSGAELTGRTITWSSDNESVATVSSAGLVTAVAVGTANITATSEGQSGSSALAVTQAPVATLTVTLGAGLINAVQTTQASATLKDSKDRVLTDRSIVWSSDNESVASVSSTGLVSAVAVGTANITATSESQSASAALTVTPAPVATVTVSPAAPSIVSGYTQQLTATLKDAQDRVLTDRTVAWVSDNTGVATVSSTGLVTAVSGGTATITGTSEAVSGTAVVTVTTPLSTVSLLRRSTQNPRYFENASGQIVYLTGSHTWSNLQDNGTTDPPAAFNYSAYLDFLESHNHNFFRLWAWEQAKWTAEISADYWITPGPFARTGPATALDGKPKFDLTQFNQAYFDRLRQRVIDAGARGVYVSVMLFDGWSVATKGGFTQNNPWKGHPFNAANNINGINGDTNGDGLGLENQTLGNSAITALQEAYVRKVIDAVGDLDNVLYEISNESDASSRDWQYHMIQVIRAYEATKPKQHPVGITAMWPGGSDTDLTSSSADWISASGSVAGTVNLPATGTGTKVLITDTDHLCGICGDMAWVWKSFAKGHNPILMDGYDDAAIGMGAADYDPSDPKWEAIRKSMGYTLSYARRMDLASAIPHGDLVLSETTGYALVKPGSQYLVFVPGGGSVTLNLSAVIGTLNVEWFNPATGIATQAGTIAGGPLRILTAPFSGPAVLFLH
jgi:uncharacterized protein YjdB